MKQKKENRVALLLHWAGGQKIWLFLAILLSMCSALHGCGTHGQSAFGGLE